MAATFTPSTQALILYKAKELRWRAGWETMQGGITVD